VVFFPNRSLAKMAKIHNIVVTANLTNKFCQYELECELQKFVDTELWYKSRAFGSLNLKISLSTVFQLFKNGRIISIGGKTEKEAKAIFDGYIEILADLGVDVCHINYRIQNIVASYNHGKRLKLASVASWNNLEYNPELFPAVRYRNKALGITCNIFHTGKCVILGAKSVASVDHITTLLQEAIKNADCGC